AAVAAAAALGLVAGISGSDFQRPTALADGFQIAMYVTAAGAIAGAVLAWTMISDDVLARAQVTDEHCTHCAVAGTPLRDRLEAERRVAPGAAEPAPASSR